MTCNDCGFPVDPAKLSEAAVARGSSVREPGEALCPSCTSSRAVLLRQVATLPGTLDQIQAKRMAGAFR